MKMFQNINRHCYNSYSCLKSSKFEKKIYIATLGYIIQSSAKKVAYLNILKD